jgi:K+-transporting ATPase ATPase C chain
MLRPTVVLLSAFTLLLGVAYPLGVTAVAQRLMPSAANGSLVVRDGEVVGSSLVGQSFSGDAYFWGRPSATAPSPYDGASSAASNFGPSNPALREAVVRRLTRLGATDARPAPVDLVTASASGLDPDISPAAAAWQVARVAAARRRSEADIRALVESQTRPRALGVFGEARVNVLELNLALDRDGR